MDELRDWIAYHRAFWIRPQPAWEAVLRAGSITKLLRGTRDDLCSFSDQDWSTIEQLRAALDWRQTDRDLRLIDKKGIQVICRDDPRYPTLLKEIIDPPLVLFWRGALPPHPPLKAAGAGSDPLPGKRGLISIVGSRKATPYGRDAIDLIVPGLVRANLAIVSGLAFGIDAAAHRACLAHQGYTVAVLASGVDEITPYTHQKLGELIMQDGALCSEVPLGVPAHASHFLWRNRIISGLSRATLIVEAEVKSGSLVTASHAADQGRVVFAVPGPITSSLSGGCNQLLRDGAIPCLDAGDILSRYASKSDGDQKLGSLLPSFIPRNQNKTGPKGAEFSRDKKYGQSKPIDATTARFLKTLSTGPCTMNQLGDRLQMPIAQVLQHVTSLECAGMLTVLPGGYITRK